MAAAFRKIGRTLKRIAREDRKVFFFLLAFFLYIDGVGTIIDNCINIGTDLGLSTVGQVIVLLATQVVAWVFALVFARLSRRHSTVTLLTVCILGYLCVCLYALTLQSLVQFGIMAFGVGMFQGSIQSLSRSYFSKIIPRRIRGILWHLRHLLQGSLLPGLGGDRVGEVCRRDHQHRHRPAGPALPGGTALPAHGPPDGPAQPPAGGGLRRRGALC